MNGLSSTKLLATGALLLALTAACSDAPADKAVTSDAPSAEAADLVLLNGQILTLDDNLGTAQALAVKDHRILAVGADADISSYVGAATRTIDLQGATAIPGLIEGHGHFLSLGRAMQILRLDDASTFDDIVAQVAKAADAAPAGAWIFGRGWHQEKWQTPPPDHLQGDPVNHALNQVAPDNPVLLGHASGHAALANDAALRAAGIDADTTDPAGGEIVRDDQGRATGMLRERAQELVEAAAAAAQNTNSSAEARQANLREQAYLAGKEALRYGVTSFHDAGTSFADIDALKALEQDNALLVRLYVMVRGEQNAVLDEKLAAYYMPLEGNDFLTVRSIKKQIDGALGAHGAWLLEPYTDKPESTGLVLTDLDNLRATADLAVKHGYQLNTHAIGTRGNRETLDTYDQAWQAARVNGADLRWRIEHAQHIHPLDLPRFASMGVIAAVQGVHCTSDGPWIPVRLGEPRTETTSYRWRDLLDSGARVNNGTDAPVESLDPFASLAASVDRRMADGTTFYPAQAMTRMEALRSYTIDNAYSAFEEDHKGTLTPGKLADIAVLDGDPLSIDDLRDLSVVYTFVGGELRYQAEANQAPAAR